MDRLDALRIQQLDEALASLKVLQDLSPPQEGWTRAIREALGMSLRQVAERAGVSKTTVQSAEANEMKGTVQLNSLARLAEAMDCELVYALVPRDSLRDTLERRAGLVAERMVERVSDSMEIEAQGIGAGERARQVDELTAEILRERGRDFWDD